jgi:hypothetical protein
MRILVLVSFLSSATFCFANENTGLETPSKIDREGIRQTFIKKEKEIKKCYEQFIKEYPKHKHEGKLVLDISIGEQGTLTYAGVSIEKSTLKSYQLAGCLQKKLFSWKFPKPPENQTVQVFYPLSFSEK